MIKWGKRLLCFSQWDPGPLFPWSPDSCLQTAGTYGFNIWSPASFLLYSLLSRRIDNWWHLQMLMPKFAERWNESHHLRSAAHMYGFMSQLLEACAEPVASWHFASVDMAGSERWAAKPNTLRPPYQFVNVMNPAGGRGNVCLRRPFECSTAHEELCGGRSGFFERELRRADSTTIQTAHRGDMTREWAGLYRG